MKIDGAVAIVSGANRGLGREFLRGLLARGAKKVYAGARDPGAIDVPGVTAIPLDVTKIGDVEAAARACGDVTLLVNNAGISLRKTLFAADTIDGARAELEVNLFGTLHMTRAFAPILARNGGGALVNILSVVSWAVLARSATYSISKAAVWSATNGIRNELRDQKTQVLAVHVGFIDTELTKGVNAPKVTTEEVVVSVLDALAGGKDEVIVDEMTRQVKAGLSSDPPSYFKRFG